MAVGNVYAIIIPRTTASTAFGAISFAAVFCVASSEMWSMESLSSRRFIIVSGDSGDELLRLLDIEHGETSSRLPRQIDILGRVRQKELPTYRLPQRREEDRVRVANRARRQISIEQLTYVESLNLRRRKLAVWPCAQSRTNVPCERGRVVAEALGPKPRASTDFKAVIEVLTEGLP